MIGSRAVQIAAVLLTLSGVASAHDDTEPIRIEYHAQRTAGCPSHEEFIRQVLSRTQDARRASGSEPARTFVVELRPEAGRVSGTLVIHEPGGASMARQVSGSGCGHVASVLALATALAIDPRAELAPDRELEPTAPPSATPGATAAAGSAAPSSAAPMAAPLGSDEPEAPDGRVRASWSARLSLGASAAFGVAPRPTFGPVALLGVRRQRATLLRDAELGFVFRTGSPELVQGARAEFRFYAARGLLCSRGLELTTRLYTAPCLAVEVGAVSAAGADLPVTARPKSFWAVVEALVRLEARLSSALFVGLEGGAVLPLTRYRFVFLDPDTRVHDVPAISAQAGLRIGADF